MRKKADQTVVADNQKVEGGAAALPAQVERLTAEVAALKGEVVAAHEAEKRALADYQNLVRRHQDDRSLIVKLAAKSFVQSLLQPLGHLALAAKQLNDTGLNMIIMQLRQALADEGLEEIEVLGRPFDVTTMEVVGTQSTDSTSIKSDAATAPADTMGVVIEVRRPGYRLNGEVIQHAQVVIGNQSSK